MSTEAHWQTPRSLRAFIFVLLLATMVLFGLVARPLGTAHASPLRPQSYNCQPCSGDVYWPNSVQGVQDKSTVDNIECIYCGPADYGFLLERSSVQYFDGATTYFVNGGYGVGYSYYTAYEEYVWADSRPVDDGYVNIHDEEQVPAGDYGGTVNDDIYLQSTNTWSIHLHSNGFNDSWNSTNNSMPVSGIVIGGDTVGNSNQVAQSVPSVYFTNNEWTNNGGASWGWQNNEGQVIQNAPAAAWWSVAPASNGSNHGGSFANDFQG